MRRFTQPHSLPLPTGYTPRHGCEALILAHWLVKTHTHTDHATCDICINRPHICTACWRYGLKQIELRQPTKNVPYRAMLAAAAVRTQLFHERDPEAFQTVGDSWLSVYDVCLYTRAGRDKLTSSRVRDGVPSHSPPRTPHRLLTQARASGADTRALISENIGKSICRWFEQSFQWTVG